MHELDGLTQYLSGVALASEGWQHCVPDVSTRASELVVDRESH